MNPISMMQAAGRIKIFQEQHPKAIAFLQSLSENDLREGSVIELKVTTPEGRESVSNIRLTKDDIETFKILKSSGV
ncbi:MAG: hypothetical protein K5871_04625 [Lachnospiraceae bacterium]|nr:hypothetical protein [Lachnospiraceae bacterium]